MVQGSQQQHDLSNLEPNNIPKRLHLEPHQVSPSEPDVLNLEPTATNCDAKVAVKNLEPNSIPKRSNLVKYLAKFLVHKRQSYTSRSAPR